MDEIKKALECGICTEIATLPVKGVCCKNAKSLPPGCLNCVRTFYELNKPLQNRNYEKKGWAGCGCNINLRNKSCKYFYEHCLELDSIRNIIGKSKCFHEECGLVFDTCAELRRHLDGTSSSNDTHGNCPEAITKCKFPNCNYHNKRKIVEGEHYERFHKYIVCDVCNLKVERINLVHHYNNHVDKLKLLREKLRD